MARILVIDDDPLTRETVVRVLEREGYEAWSAPDGKQALELYGRIGFELVITGIFMPECDGLETIAALRRRAPQAKIIAIASSSGQDRYLRAAKAFGAADSLARPFDSQRLLDSVAELVRR